MDMTSLDHDLDRLRTIPVPSRPPVDSLAERARHRRQRRRIGLTLVSAVALVATGLGVEMLSSDDDVRVESNRLDTPPVSGTPPAAGDAAVPDVVGLTLSAATEAVGGAGLVLSVEDGDAAFADAVVVAIEPGAGSELEAGAVVGARTALPDPPVDVECPDSRHPRGRAGADALPRAEALDRQAADAELISLRQQIPDSSETQVFLGIWDRWAVSPNGGAVGRAEGFQLIVVGQDPNRCPSAPQFRTVPITYVVGDVGSWAGDSMTDDPERDQERDEATRAAIALRDTADSFVAFAGREVLTQPEQVPLADRVRLGLGDQLKAELTGGDLVDRSAWLLDLDGFRARSGVVLLLDLLPDREVTATIGDHAGCAGIPSPRPVELAGLARVSLQPEVTESCLEWFAVDLFIDASGRVAAVTLDLYEP